MEKKKNHNKVGSLLLSKVLAQITDLFCWLLTESQVMKSMYHHDGSFHSFHSGPLFLARMSFGYLPGDMAASQYQ